MKGYEKFNNRIAELLGLSGFAYVDEETADLIPIGAMDGDVPVVFSLNIRNNGKQEFLETRFPTFDELKKNNDFVGQLIREFGYENPVFIKDFVEWVSDENGEMECPLRPEDIYFLNLDFSYDCKLYKDD